MTKEAVEPEATVITQVQGGRVKDALAALRLPLKTQEVQLVGKKTPLSGYKAVVREDTGRVLSIVGSRYQLVTHEEMMEPALAQLDKEGWEVKQVRLERHGGWAFVKMILPGLNLGTGSDKLVPQLTWVNSVDMRSSMRGLFGIYRLVCSNGMTVAAKGYEMANLSYRTSHVGSALGRMDAGFTQQLANRLELIKEIGKTYRGLVNQKVPAELAERLFQKTAGPRQVDRLLHIWRKGEGQDGGENAYQVYNAITNWLTHEAKGGEYLRQIRSKQALQLLQDPRALRALPKLKVA